MKEYLTHSSFCKKEFISIHSSRCVMKLFQTSTFKGSEEEARVDGYNLMLPLILDTFGQDMLHFFMNI